MLGVGGKMASAFKTISLGCKHPALQHVPSFRRQVFMFLESPENTPDISFRVKHEGRTFMIYASTGNMKCFECGDIGHKRLACPHKGHKEVAVTDTRRRTGQLAKWSIRKGQLSDL
ncbi:hypothetical protein QTP70_031015, partial [Hemibagrus guttatus]